jgi:hypothetical protein
MVLDGTLSLPPVSERRPVPAGYLQQHGSVYCANAGIAAIFTTAT